MNIEIITIYFGIFSVVVTFCCAVYYIKKEHGDFFKNIIKASKEFFTIETCYLCGEIISEEDLNISVNYFTGEEVFLCGSCNLRVDNIFIK
jgi:hypothetical protein